MYQCPQCWVVFFPRPINGSADYGEYYPYLSEFSRERFEWEIRIRRGKYRYQLARIRRYAPEARFLTDIGAGPGYFCKVATESGWIAVGVEASEPAISAGRREFQVCYSTLDNVVESSQDVVTCHHVLEHIEEPRGFLEAVRSKLRRGGLLVVLVPHREPLTFAGRFWLDRLRRHDPDRRCQLYYPEHITGFCATSLQRAVEAAGFQCLGVRSVSMWSRYYDPFFLANYFRDTAGRRLPRVPYLRVVGHALRCVADNIGALVNRGDWLVGYFRAP